MTVNYTAQVATCTNFGRFIKLLNRWRGSIYKIIWMDLIAYLVLYYTLAFVYRFVLNAEGRHIFENIKGYCRNNSLIPVTFVLGFYVSIIMKRWWNQYLLLPRPDATAVLVSSLIHGQDERGRIIRRTIARYLCFAFTMTLGRISPSVKRRFPTWDHMVDAGFLVEKEKNIMLRVDNLMARMPKFWVPIIWAVGIVTRARQEGRIRDDFAQMSIITEINKFRGKCAALIFYETIGVPLVYTQVVTLAVYTFFACSIMDNQWVDIQDEEGYDHWMEKYFPIFTILEFFFYVGWLKVAETLINPFGEDDDDFEVNWLIDRHLQVSYLIVDEMHQEHPELVRDQYWDEVFPARLPFFYKQVARDEPPEASTAKIGLAKESFSIYGPLSTSIARQSKARAILSNIRNTFNFSTTDFRQVGVVAPQPHEYNEKNSGTLVLVKDAVDSMDDFDLLRTEREKERLRRQQIKLLRAVENLIKVNNVAAIMSILPVRRLAVSDSEKNLANTEEELEVVADVQDKQKTSKQRDAFERLKEDRLQRRQHRQKHSLAKTVAELNDTANAAKILVRKKSAKKIALADQSEDTAAAKQSNKAKDSTSTASLSKKSESVLSTRFFSKLFKPEADSSALAEQMSSSSKVRVDVKKAASTATLVPVEQTASTSSPSWILNNDSSAATLYFDPSSASTLEVDEEDIKEAVPAQTTVRLTQGRNLLPVDSDESMYFDPSEITLVASEEELKKKETKYKK